MSNHFESQLKTVFVLVAIAALLGNAKGPTLLEQASNAIRGFWSEILLPLLVYVFYAVASLLMLFTVFKLVQMLYRFWSTHEIVSATELFDLRLGLHEARTKIDSLTDTVHEYHMQKTKLEATLQALTLESEKAKQPAESVVADAVKDILRGLT